MWITSYKKILVITKLSQYFLVMVAAIRCCSYMRLIVPMCLYNIYTTVLMAHAQLSFTLLTPLFVQIVGYMKFYRVLIGSLGRHSP